MAASNPEAGLSEQQARRIDLIWSVVMVSALAAIYLVLSLFSGVAIPVLLALAMAYVLNPVTTWLAQRGLGRTGGTAVVFLGLALLWAGAVLYLIPVLAEEGRKLPSFFQRAGTQALPWLEDRIGLPLPELLRKRAAELSDEAASVLTSAGPTLARVLAAFAGNTARVVATLMGLVLVPVLGFFFLKDYPRLIALAGELVPRRALGLVSARFAEVDEVLSAFARGQLTVGGILAVLYTIGFSIAGIDLAVVIGALTGFGNLVPFLGTGLGVALSLLALVLSWQGSWQLLVLALTFVLAQLAESLVITPRVVGEKVGLPPVAVILAVLGFGQLFGFVGMLLAVPTAAVLKVVIKVVLERYRRTSLYSGA